MINNRICFVEYERQMVRRHQVSEILLTVCFVCVVNLFCSCCANGCMLFCFVCVVPLVVLFCYKNIECYPLQRQKRRNQEHE